MSLVLLSACLSSAGPEAPTITEQPKDRVAFIGQAGKFDFGGSGKPPFTFQWLRNGAAISGATAATYTTPVLTAADVPGLNDVGPVVHDEELLASARVHFLGQAVALVVGESLEEFEGSLVRAPALDEPARRRARGGVGMARDEAREEETPTRVDPCRVADDASRTDIDETVVTHTQ